MIKSKTKSKIINFFKLWNMTKDVLYLNKYFRCA